MSAWFIILNLILLLSSSVLPSRFQINSKRRYSMSTKSFFPPPFPFDDNSMYASDDDSLTESSTTTTTPPASAKHRASEQQVQQFTRLLYERLNLKEPPNVTFHVQDGTGIPSSIVKQLEEHHMHQNNEDKSFLQQKNLDETQPTTERAILPGDFISSHACQRQLAVKFNLNKENTNQIDCFAFTKSLMEAKGLPTNQIIKQLRIYVKKNYFHINDEQENSLTPDMFQIYQVFRPTSNETSPTPFHGMTGTTRLPISQVKELNDKWFELTIDANNGQISIQQIYKQFIMPWYGLAINRELQMAPSWSSFYRRYYSKKNIDGFLRSYDEENNGKESQQQLPYMLVEYGDKIPSASSGNRGTRNTKRARPARACEPNSPCCRRSLFIDLDEASNALNFVIYPRKIDIGECVGLCGTSGSSLKLTDVKNAQHKNEQNAGYNLLLLQYKDLYRNKSTTTTQINNADQKSTNCCSYSRTGGLEIMYTTTNGGPIIRKFLPNMIVEECRCGLAATI